MICSACGLKILDEEDVYIHECPRCWKPFTEDRAAAHIPNRPEQETVGGPNAPLPGNYGSSPRASQYRPEVEELEPGPAQAVDPLDSGKCPYCGGKLAMQEGCMHCPNGCWSACG